MGGSRPRAQNTGKKKWMMDWIDDFLRQENTVDDKEHNTHKKDASASKERSGRTRRGRK